MAFPHNDIMCAFCSCLVFARFLKVDSYIGNLALVAASSYCFSLGKAKKKKRKKEEKIEKIRILDELMRKRWPSASLSVLWGQDEESTK